MTVQFSNNYNWEKQLGPLEYFSSPVYTRGSLFFKGEIDLMKFIRSMSSSFNYFHLLLSHFSTDKKGNIWACNSTKKINSTTKEQLEIEYINEPMESATFENTLPKKTIKDVYKLGFAKDLNGMVMAAFKLTIFNDGFCIGYTVNHSFFDQASIYYYLKFLSQIYSNDGENLTFLKPQIFDSQNFINNKVKFDGIINAREYGDSNFGFIFYTMSQKPSEGSIDINFFHNTTIGLKFDLEEINKIKSKNSNYLSTNDIISAIVLKVLTLTEFLKDSDDFTLRYVCNVRKYLEKGEEAIGNFAHHCKMILKVKEIKESSILDLANIDRKSILGIHGDDFKDSLNWYKYMQDEKEVALTYVGKPSFYSSRITNWTNFDYDAVQFDKVSPHSIKTPSLAGYGINTITFTTEHGKKYFTTGVSIPIDCMEKLDNFGKTSKLFSIDNIFN
ncbi:hypothetical protein DICPUDRAFT_34764 [Dictyostelium purpureum]|uniref:Condensation domain-containing protein n=1 Tax=Dictyostelium purpureum TaxID=5786 RepID=F0ZN89_DICPU|nr:uncharacterized protein DICPUDRAFT_34764 [Dictyostelium purpureum]EGC34598.1 hypothetical protein DICPUDRAFT_34764 [Dictyostelium purpureum]|eukprot:XP_003288875.1 hypothetical protein DICPUDRAFT_34764 [Dictyostelium purpureum]